MSVTTLPASFEITGDSTRESIVKNVKSTLETITETNGYSHTVIFVDREQIGEINRPAWPNILILEGEETAERRIIAGGPGGKWMKLLRLILSAAIEAREDLNTQTNLMLANMEKAILADHSRGGLAIDTRIVGNRQYITGEGEPIGAVDLEIEIHYRHDERSPFTNT